MKNVIGAGMFVAILAVGGYGYWWVSRPMVDTTIAVVAPTAPVIKKVKKIATAVKSVQTFSPEAKLKLSLPPAVIADETKQVTGATTVTPSERRVTVTSVLDTATGETTTFAKAEPLPWFALEARGEVRIDMGYKWKRGIPAPVQVSRLSIRHDFVQVKGFHAGVNAAIDGDGERFAGIGIGYRW